MRSSSGRSSSTSTASTQPSRRLNTTRAEREAAKDRSALLEAQGDDANNANEKIVEIRKTVSG